MCTYASFFLLNVLLVKKPRDNISISTRHCWTDFAKNMWPISTSESYSWREDDVQRRTIRFEVRLCAYTRLFFLLNFLLGSARNC